MPLDLQDLLTRAMARQTPMKPRRRPSDSISPEELAQAERRIRARFNAPESWKLRQNIILIHRTADQTETILGNFEEYVNIYMADCRKLKRVERPAGFSGQIEYVTGANWLADERPWGGKQAEAAAEDVTDAMLDLHLPELDHVFAADVLLSVTRIWGGIARVELCQETRFYSRDKRVQLILPDEMDVLEVMSWECKVKLREFLQQQDEHISGNSEKGGA